MGNVFSQLPTGKELALAAPTWPAQLCLGGIHAGLWYVVIEHILPPISKRIICSLKSKDKLLKLNKDVFKKILKYDLGDDPEVVLQEVAKFEGVIAQHGLGGLLCLPSMMSWGSPGLRGALARHGGLCELGWELEDTLCRAHDVCFGGEAGKAKNPPGLCAAFAMHHSAAQSLVYVMNIHYPNNVYYHEGIFMLQGAAFAAFMLQQYGFTLDVTTEAGLNQMRAVITVSSGIMWWSRFFRYSFVWGMLFRQFYRDGDTLCMKMAAPAVVGMSLFNIAILADASTKFMKFMKMKVGDTAKDIDDHAADALTAASPVGAFTMTKSQKEWAKVRAAVRWGLVKGQKGKDETAGEFGLPADTKKAD